MNDQSLRERRPAETSTGAVGLVVAIAAVVFQVELDPGEVAVLVAGVAAVPGIVTKLVDAVRDGRLGGVVGRVVRFLFG